MYDLAIILVVIYELCPELLFYNKNKTFKLRCATV